MPQCFHVSGNSPLLGRDIPREESNPIIRGNSMLWRTITGVMLMRCRKTISLLRFSAKSNKNAQMCIFIPCKLPKESLIEIFLHEYAKKSTSATGSYERARADWEKALQLEPNNADMQDLLETLQQMDRERSRSAGNLLQNL
jgi:hypothetical protein